MPILVLLLDNADKLQNIHRQPSAQFTSTTLACVGDPVFIPITGFYSSLTFLSNNHTQRLSIKKKAISHTAIPVAKLGS